ncbi:MAG: alpha/beta family hydrolase [Pseudomonadota bacterium]
MRFLIDGDVSGRPTVLFAHGAGAPMDTAFMVNAASELAARGLRVARFEFAYMAARRQGGGKRPPPKAEALCDEYVAAVGALSREGPLVIGGKSMGGRVASLVADDLLKARRIEGLLCLGYPFHPPGRPDRLRTSHLEEIETPTLICQGTRDKFGSRQEVECYRLSEKVELFWLEDGDHDLKPRKSVTGEGQDDSLGRAAERTAVWLASLAT